MIDLLFSGLFGTQTTSNTFGQAGNNTFGQAFGARSEYFSLSIGTGLSVNINICSHGLQCNRIWNLWGSLQHRRGEPDLALWRKPTAAAATTTELLLQFRWRNYRSFKLLRGGHQLWLDIWFDCGGGSGGDWTHQVPGHHQHGHHDEGRPVSADQYEAPVHHLYEGVREQEHGGAPLRGLHRRQEGRGSHGCEWQHVWSGSSNYGDCRRTVWTTTTAYFVLWRLGGTFLRKVLLTIISPRTVWTAAAEHQLTVWDQWLRSQHHDQCNN